MDSPHVSISLTDVDECVIFPSVCDYPTRCFNTHGSYYCRCIPGFRGDFSCECMRHLIIHLA